MVAALIAAAYGPTIVFWLVVGTCAVLAVWEVGSLYQVEKHGLTKAEADRLDSELNDLEDTLSKWRLRREHVLLDMSKALHVDKANIEDEMRKDTELVRLSDHIDELLNMVHSPILALSIREPLGYQSIVALTDRRHLECLLGECTLPEYLEIAKAEREIRFKIEARIHGIRVEHKPARSRL